MIRGHPEMRNQNVYYCSFNADVVFLENQKHQKEENNIGYISLHIGVRFGRHRKERGERGELESTI